MYEIHGIPPDMKKSILIRTYPLTGLGWQLAQKKVCQMEEEGYRSLKIVEVKSKI
jgi:hypothetical protein